MPASERLVALSLLGYGSVCLLGFLKLRYASHSKTAQYDQTEFELAADFFTRNSNRFTNEEQIELYSLFKQRKDGDYDASISSIIETPGSRRRLMNEAWMARKGLTPDQAEAEYIRLLDLISPAWRNETGGELQKGDVETSERSGWAVGSVPLELVGNKDTDDTLIGKLCEMAAEGNFDRVREEILRDPGLAALQDKDGMGCLHWASDRGHAGLVTFLLSMSADPNIQDDYGNTPLHLGGQSGHEEVVRLLIEAKADVQMRNHDGESGFAIIQSECTGVKLES
jgi:acyl-CoA-binding protein